MVVPQKTISAVLDPEFAADLQASVKHFDDCESEADNERWNIAFQVNEMWPEHENNVDDRGEKIFPTKKEYYAECSRVANLVVKRKRFSDSGETLRRWCEVQESYNQWRDAVTFLDHLSFDHLYKARKLYKDGKVSPPVLALAEAVRRKWTADEMKEHYDPTITPHPYDIFRSNINNLLSAKLEFIKSAEVRKRIKAELSKIDQEVRDEIEKERKAV